MSGSHGFWNKTKETTRNIWHDTKKATEDLWTETKNAADAVRQKFDDDFSKKQHKRHNSSEMIYDDYDIYEDFEEDEDFNDKYLHRKSGRYRRH